MANSINCKCVLLKYITEMYDYIVSSNNIVLMCIIVILLFTINSMEKNQMFVRYYNRYNIHLNTQIIFCFVYFEIRFRTRFG